MLVGHILAGRAMFTPGSYRLSVKTGRSKERPANTRDKVERGRPIKKRVHRQSYTELDTKEAIRLVQEDGLTILMTASFTNDRKLNAVPRNFRHENYTIVFFSKWIWYPVQASIYLF
jgi:hypothetical protein